MSKKTVVMVLGVIVVGAVLVGVPLGLAYSYGEGVKRGTTDQEVFTKAAEEDARTARDEADVSSKALRELEQKLADMPSSEGSLGDSYHRGVYDVCIYATGLNLSEEEKTNPDNISKAIQGCTEFVQTVVDAGWFNEESVGYAP